FRKMVHMVPHQQIHISQLQSVSSQAVTNRSSQIQAPAAENYAIPFKTSEAFPCNRGFQFAVDYQGCRSIVVGEAQTNYNHALRFSQEPDGHLIINTSFDSTQVVGYASRRARPPMDRG